MLTLKDFTPNQKGRVQKITATPKLRQRLYDMGITPGTEIVMKKAAPLGDPIEITLRGYQLMIRKDEASAVQMQ